jgi:hypothetical protein
MKKELSGPATAAILALDAILVASVGWYVINRPSPTVATTGGNVTMEGARGARSMGNAASADPMPGSP